MLNNIRKTAHTLLMRILLGMIAFAFIGWGIKDALLSTNNYDLVTFSDTETITEEDFLKSKAQQIRNIQKQTGLHLTEQELASLNINKLALGHLVNNRMIAYLTNYYDLDLNDDFVIKLLQDTPDFKNEHGLFDVTLFENFIKHSYVNEAEYLSDVKEAALKSTLISIFLESFKTPQIMINNIVDYMAEARDVDIIEIDLTKRPKGLIIPTPTTEQLEELYKSNQESFALPERRSLSYIKVSSDILQKQLHDNNNELSQTEKLEQFFFTLVKNLEDEVAAGSSLVEIANKYELPIQNIDNINYTELSGNNTVLSSNAETIFELEEKELSYPIELPDNKTFVLVEVKSVQPKKVPELSSIVDQVRNLWNENYVRNINIKTMEQVAKEYKITNNNKAFTEVKIDNNISLLRSEAQNNKVLPPELISSIFQTNVGSNTPVFQQKNNAYFAHIRLKRIDKKQNKEILQNNIEDISTAIKNNVIDELIIYAVKKNKMKIVKHFPN